jgi:hypothetical protein
MPSERDKPMRRFWQVSIRELLIWTVAVSLAMGWWLDRFRLESELNRQALDFAQRSRQSMTLETGPLKDGMEGLFALDHVTGDLYCTVPNARTGGLYQYQHNVCADLTVKKTANSRFTMVIGEAKFQRGDTIADSIVYVADTSTGNWIAYGLPWDWPRGASFGVLQTPKPFIQFGRGTFPE